MSRKANEQDRDRLREILDAIESGEIVIKQAADDVIQELQDRMDDFDGPTEQSATGCARTASGKVRVSTSSNEGSAAQVGPSTPMRFCSAAVRSAATCSHSSRSTGIGSLSSRVPIGATPRRSSSDTRSGC